VNLDLQIFEQTHRTALRIPERRPIHASGAADIGASDGSHHVGRLLRINFLAKHGQYGGSRLVGKDSARLERQASKQAPAGRHDQVQRAREGTHTLAKQRHTLCIAAKRANIGANPTQRQLLIEQAEINGARVRVEQLLGNHESKHAETIIDGHHDGAARTCSKARTIVQWQRVASLLQVNQSKNIDYSLDVETNTVYQYTNKIIRLDFANSEVMKLVKI
jgi:hypothetical protein